MLDHVFGDNGLGDLDAQFQQLAVNARCTQRGLLRLIIVIRSRTSFGTLGRPGLPRCIFQVQNKRKPLRRHATTVSGLTIIRADFQSVHTRCRQTQKTRSAGVIFRRLGAERLSLIHI